MPAAHVHQRCADGGKAGGQQQQPRSWLRQQEHHQPRNGQRQQVVQPARKRSKQQVFAANDDERDQASLEPRESFG
jgi:hypothetical protein